MFSTVYLKLTGWYLLIIMFISLLFSGLVYQSSMNEIATRLEQFREGVPQVNGFPRAGTLQTIRDAQQTEAGKNILLQLVYINVVILIGGGAVSYLLARRTLQPLEEAHEAQSRFTSDASHELRTPLAAMKTELEASLRDSKLTKGDMKQLLESNLEEVDKLTQLSQTLLALSRLDTSAIPTEPLNLEDLLNDAIKSLKLPPSRLKRTNVAPLLIAGNRSSLTELITILLDNAVKYSPKGSPLTITTETKGKNTLLSITNTGAGIDTEDMPHIFERFYRAEKARSKSTTNGYGLGLALAKQIAELHGGTIQARSTPGKSTTFTITLPVA